MQEVTASTLKLPSPQKCLNSKVQVMAQKYRKYLRVTDKQKEHSSQSYMFLCYSSLKKCWQFVIPICLRSFMDEYQLFQHELQNKKLKWCQNHAISNLPIEDEILQTRKICLGLVYTSHELGQVVETFEQFTHSNPQRFKYFPLNKEGKSYQKYYEHKIRFMQDSMLMVYWKGLFNELMVLEVLSLTEPELFSRIETVLEERSNYEENIRREASEAQTTYSDVVEQSNISLK